MAIIVGGRILCLQATVACYPGDQDHVQMIPSKGIHLLGGGGDKDRGLKVVFHHRDSAA